MLPSILTTQVRQGIEDHLRASFAPSAKSFDQIIDRFIDEPDSLIKGPWLTLEMPFRRAETAEDFFPAIPLGFRPYRHQERAFQRLAGEDRLSTLIATGTGSGKTECFLLPILDACVRAKGKPGIKAIIIYPMNALASDQARRLASLVSKNPELSGLRVGLYADERPTNPTDEMTEVSVIDSRTALVQNPPDILLTNYKMLDYMLIRPDEREMWEQNGPETLRYLVVDELHTFDGAQGTDLASLIRRLKSRLGMRHGSLCCVGTSATLGGPDATGDLLGYAKAVFDETFDPESIVTEDRQTVAEYLNGIDIQTSEIPETDDVRRIVETASETGRVPLLKKAFAGWFGEAPPPDVDDPDWRIDLGARLNGHVFLQGLLRIMQGRATSFAELCVEIRRSKQFKLWNDQDLQCLLDTFLALVAHARRVDAPGSISLRPFFNVRSQLWVREMRRMVATVSETPRLWHHDDLDKKEQLRALPVVHCRSCGAAGWVTVQPNDSRRPLSAEPQDVYDAYFGYSDQLRFLFRERPLPRGQKGLAGQVMPALLCSECLNHQAGEAEPEHPCPSCGAPAEALMKVFTYMPGHFVGATFEIDHDCAFCSSPSGMGILGAQSVTLVSGLIGTVFGSDFNDDPKLLTFSDSVQDAAHRAAVFQARNATTVFRAGLARFVCEEAEQPDVAASMAKAPTFMLDGQTTPEDFVATYLPADMEWREDYETLLRDDALPEGSRLADFLEERLSWETFAELTFKSRLGETLERSGVAVAHVDGAEMLKLASDLTARLADELGPLWKPVELGLVRKFLLGLFDHMRARGAVATDVTRLFVQREAKWFPVAKINKSLPNISPAAPKPLFPANCAVPGFENYATTSAGGWYRAWFNACFDHAVTLTGDQCFDFYSLAFRLMENQGIAERMTIGTKDRFASGAWGLKPEHVHVFSSTALVKCGICGNSHRVPALYSALWAGAPCTRVGCAGKLSDADDSDRTRFRSRLMTTGRIKRVVAAEHTSLLKREQRQWVEERFMQEAPKAWYPNLLAATPTLEMGINIGDLSTLVLCSVPPEQANYVQRIGRTGRRDGNSLNVTVAMAKPHDMWFWTDPQEMIAGQVKAPGVHLHAVAILRRQFAAFTLDRWVAEKGAGVQSYGKVGDALRAIKSNNRNMFPLYWFEFISANATRLFEDFVTLFPEMDDRESLEQLHAYAHGGETDGLAHMVATEFLDAEAEIVSIQARIETSTAVGNKLKKQVPPDLDLKERLKDVDREKRSLRKIRDEIRKDDTLGFLTARGILPNYAFPSEGVTLKSILYRTKEEGEADEDPTIGEYVRPSSSALSEFAPGSRFYTQGRKFKIDQIDLSASPVEYWRVCPECIHIERAAVEKTESGCPACGSAMWADKGSRRPMIRLKQVLATGTDRSTKIADDGDDRERKFFDRDYLPAIDRDQIGDAYAMDDEAFPFGFEFLRRCTFREVNFGENGDAPTGQKVAGQNRYGHGFKICRSCGKVQDRAAIRRLKPEDRDKGIHLSRCSETRTATEETFVSVVYIYREFSSEAIRVLLPFVTSYDDDAVNSLSAGIDLGLRLHFKGKVSHLRSTLVETKEGPLTRRYLFLYDSVPGGTGYLKQLSSRPDELRAVFQMAHDHMRACACNTDPKKDGCPRCIRSHSATFGSGEISRDSAVRQISEILSGWDTLKRVATVSDVKLNKALESELEQMFIERLRGTVKAGGGVFNKIVIAGKPGYYVKVGSSEWNVELQCWVDERFAKVPKTRVDLMLWPAVPMVESKPIAVYLDGWEFHGHSVAEDLVLRQKLIRSGHMHVWSATWKDVETAVDPSKPRHYWEPFKDGSAKLPAAMMEKLINGESAAQDAQSYVDLCPFDQFIEYLRKPHSKVWEERARALATGWFLAGMPQGKDREAVSRSVEELAGDDGRKTLEDASTGTTWGCVKADGVGVIATAMPKSWKPPGWPDCADLTVVVGFEHRLAESSEAKKAWNGALRLLNVVQFLPYFYVGCSEGIDLPASLRLSEAPVDGWDEVENMVLSAVLTMVRTMRVKRFPVPEALFEAVGDDGEVMGTLELAWPDRRVGLVVDESLVDAFPGWKIIVFKAGSEMPEEFMETAS
jgi:DEAD/DEAH box helicase domain-containing protein